METLPQLPGLENWWDQARAKIISFKPRCNFFISACAICGVLCISLPIPIIVNNFNKFYEKAKIEEEILAKKKRTSWEEAKRGNIIITILLFQNTLFSGIFQNIHDSFDEIDSKTLNNMYKKSAAKPGKFFCHTCKYENTYKQT